MKRIAETAVMIALAVLLGGCYPSERKEFSDAESPENSVTQQSGAEQSGELPQTENLTMSVNAPAETPSEVASIKLTLKKWDKDEIEKLLLTGKEIEEQFERDCQFIPNEKHYSYDTKDQLRIYFEPGHIVIDDKEALGGEYKYGSVVTWASDCTASGGELAAFTREDAVNRVNALLDKLGITNYGEPFITPIKADYANMLLASYEGREDKYGNRFEFTRWTENEEIYVLQYPFVFENIELARYPFLLPQQPDAMTSTPTVSAIVSKDKIISLCASGIYSADCERAENIPIRFDFNNALKELKNFSSDAATGKPIMYFSGKMVYVPREIADDQMTVTFVPAWEFLGYCELFEEPSPFDRRRECQYFFADTGYRYFVE